MARWTTASRRPAPGLQWLQRVLRQVACKENTGLTNAHKASLSAQLFFLVNIGYDAAKQVMNAAYDALNDANEAYNQAMTADKAAQFAKNCAAARYVGVWLYRMGFS